MHFIVLASDYDGTLAHDGVVDHTTVAAIKRLRNSGRRIVLVTGRHLPDLCNIFPRLELFDRVVVENGGLLYWPETREQKLLCSPPNERFINLLRDRNVPFSVGRTIVATWKPHDTEVLAAIRDLGLDLQVIFNKGSVMVLPSGVNKGTGLKAALDELGVSYHNVVSVGDAENDLSFMRLSACSVAVGNALPSLKENADVVMEKPRGEGVTEVIDQLIKDDLAGFDAKLSRHSISLGFRIPESAAPTNGDQKDHELLVSPRGASILIAGPSASGKSTAVAGILEELLHHGYQFCLIDPEGDYDGFTDALSFGSAKESPDTKAAFRAMQFPKQSVVVNLLGVKMDDRAGSFASLLPHIIDLRARSARPHWLIIDETHHLLPSSWSPANATVPQLLESTILITVHPEHVAKVALQSIDIVMAIGKTPAQIFRSFAETLAIEPPSHENVELQQGQALVWFPKLQKGVVHVRVPRSNRERLRHARQYAEGELSRDQSFYFRGPESKLNLRAQNLKTFLQLAEGVDDETWMFHLRNGDYSTWFETIVKDSELKRQTAEIERDQNISAQESRNRIKQAVEARYTAPA
jgi:phosphoglycolate phosphatase (TIGR01487 family)